MTTCLNLLNDALQTHSYDEIAEIINVAKGTIKRWIDLESVPKAYCFELMRLNNIDIDYSKFSYKEKDQFFTPKETVKYCYNKTLEVLKKYNVDEYHYTYIEPSAGKGTFLDILPKNRRIGIDIESDHKEVIKSNYLDWRPELVEAKYIVIGNPPFGLRGQLSLKFINHSALFADFVCFILPQMFESDGKGVPRKRVKGLNLIYSEKLKTDFENNKGNCIKVEVIFQIWAKDIYNEKYTIKPVNNETIKIYSLSDGGTPSTTRNKKMFNKCDIYLPSTCFGKENMKCFESFKDLPRQKGYGIVFIEDDKKLAYIQKAKEVKWDSVAFLSTNSAYNIRSSQIIEVFLSK
jgi:hypothetical protein